MNLKQLRTNANMTVKEVATICKCQPIQIDKWESGEVIPSYLNLEKYLHAVGYDLQIVRKEKR